MGSVSDDERIEAAVAAERDRIRNGILGCTRCGKVHEYRVETCECGKPHPDRRTWADPDDGHAYSAAYVSGSAELVRRVLDGDRSPATP